MVREEVMCLTRWMQRALRGTLTKEGSQSTQNDTLGERFRQKVTAFRGARASAA